MRNKQSGFFFLAGLPLLIAGGLVGGVAVIDQHQAGSSNLGVEQTAQVETHAASQQSAKEIAQAQFLDL